MIMIRSVSSRGLLFLSNKVTYPPTFVLFTSHPKDRFYSIASPIKYPRNQQRDSPLQVPLKPRRGVPLAAHQRNSGAQNVTGTILGELPNPDNGVDGYDVTDVTAPSKTFGSLRSGLEDFTVLVIRLNAYAPGFSHQEGIH